MRLIDADALIQSEFKNDISYKAFVNLVKRQPTIERKTGEWIIEPHEVKGMYIHRCAMCMNVLMIAPTNRPKYSYCPNCGADMRGEGHE